MGLGGFSEALSEDFLGIERIGHRGGVWAVELEHTQEALKEAGGVTGAAKYVPSRIPSLFGL